MHNGNTQNIKSLIHLLDDPDNDIIVHVEQQILQFGELAIEDLELEWENSDSAIIVQRIENLIFEIKSDKFKNLLQKWLDKPFEEYSKPPPMETQGMLF